MNEIVNQHNDLIDLPLRRFNASEINILLALCSQCQEQGTTTIELKFNQISQLSDFRSKNKKELIDAISETNKKLLQLNFKIGTEIKFTQFVLFPTFEVDGEKETLTVQVHEKFAYLLNDLSGNYTALELRQSNSLRSTYAKAMYKKLRKYRDTGEWIVTLEDFRMYLDIPKSYGLSDINKRVINPSLNELMPYFEKLKVTTITKKKSQGRGRPSVTGYKFTFAKQSHSDRKEPEPLTQGQIAEKTGWKRTGKYCPRCKREMYCSVQQNENGTYPIYGHTDWKTGDCDYHTYDISDLLDEYQLHDDEPVTKEQEENKKKLKKLFASMFKN